MPEKLGKINSAANKFRWDRGITHYWIASVFKGESSEASTIKLIEGEEWVRHSNDLAKDWSGWLITLPQPILVDDFTLPRIDLDGIRLHPPFRLNSKSATSELYEDIEFPAESGEYSTIPPHTVKGASLDLKLGEAQMCSGLRIDIKDGHDLVDSLVWIRKLSVSAHDNGGSMPRINHLTMECGSILN